jgi:hypothetical protein
VYFIGFKRFLPCPGGNTFVSAYQMATQPSHRLCQEFSKPLAAPGQSKNHLTLAPMRHDALKHTLHIIFKIVPASTSGKRIAQLFNVVPNFHTGASL